VAMWDQSALSLDPETGIMTVSSGGEPVASIPALQLAEALGSYSYWPEGLHTETRVLYTVDGRRWHMGTIEVDSIAPWDDRPRITLGRERIMVLAGDGDEPADRTVVYVADRP
jgi:hypothetical protein